MTDSIFHWMTALIGVALIAALAEPFLSKNAIKQTLRVITAASLIVIVLTPLLHPDLASYASALRREETSDLWDAEAAAEQDRLLNRTLIESECRSYILDKGKSLNVPIEDASVSLRWDTEGYWVPAHAQITVTYENERSDQLRDLITTELGIAPSEQEWRTVHEP